MITGSPFSLWSLGHQSTRTQGAEAACRAYEYNGNSFNVTAQLYFRVRGEYVDGDSGWDIT